MGTGNGTEVACGALIVPGDQRKVGLISPHLIPAVAICDPELTVGHCNMRCQLHIFRIRNTVAHSGQFR
jgi:hypothetical protein